MVRRRREEGSVSGMNNKNQSQIELQEKNQVIKQL
jgi:hypothetical protein